MISNKGEFHDQLTRVRTFWVVYNAPGNQITGEFDTPEQAAKCALPGDVVYKAETVTTHTASFVKNVELET